jgi:hypothetical protein
MTERKRRSKAKVKRANNKKARACDASICECNAATAVDVGTEVHKAIERRSRVSGPPVTIYDLLGAYADVIHRKAKR